RPRGRGRARHSRAWPRTRRRARRRREVRATNSARARWRGRRTRARPSARASACRGDGNVGAVRVTVLGAGYMGSAMAKVAQMRGPAGRLWGPGLDDALLDPGARGEEPPRLKLTLDGIGLFRAADLAAALAGAELVVHAVNSDGVVP